MVEYEVESVNEAQLVKKSKKVFWEFNVKWKGYGTEENTWEPYASFKGSEDVIDTFWSRIDLGGRDWRNVAAFKINEKYMATGPPRPKRKPSQRNLKADDVTPTASGSSAGPSKEGIRSGKRRRSSPPAMEEDEKPAKRTRGRVSEPAVRPAPAPAPRTPREPRRPPTKPTTSTSSIRRTKKPSPSPDFVPASEDEEDDVAMLVDPDPEPPSFTKDPTQEEIAPSSIAPDPANEAPTEPTEGGPPRVPSHRGRAAKPRVQMVDDFKPLDGAISAKARLQSGTSKEAPAAGPSSSPRRSARKPGPGRSSSGMVNKTTSSLLTFEKGALKTVKGKFAAPAGEEDIANGNLVDETPAVPPTSDELLKLGGFDSKAADALDDFDEEDVVASPTEESPESNPNQESLTLAKNKLFPPGMSMAATVSSGVKAVWRRATIFGPLYNLPLLPHFSFLSVLFPRGLGSDVVANAPSESKPFSLKLDTTVIVPLDLTDVHQSLDTIIGNDGPPGKFFKDTNAIKLLIPFEQAALRRESVRGMMQRRNKRRTLLGSAHV
ncbi:hypothetical protein K438DRAFT_2010394 [Mycena galopus ATCC 62051]|nr:hypothetical protein K438DRAFT_2010394 [Mycena galopus ATCC 62051]